MDQTTPKDIMHRRAMLAVLALAVIGAGGATIMHRLEAAPHLMDLVIPPVLALLFLAGFLVLWFRPPTLSWILPSAFIIAMIGIAVPAWYYPTMAFLDPSLRLVDVLPPISPSIFPVLAGIMLFLQPQRLLLTGLLCWLVIAAPVLTYLGLHPEQLLTPRGKDLFIGLGPVTGIAMLVLYLHMDINRRLSSAQAELNQLRLLAERDVETGLYNERAGREVLNRILSDHVPTGGVVMFRIDSHKAGNHSAGTIIEIARRCETFLRRTDFFIRWNRDTFMVICDDVDIHECELTAEHLRQMISGAPVLGAGTVHASFAVTEFRYRDTQAAVMMKLERSLLRLASLGGNRVEIVE